MLTILSLIYDKAEKPLRGLKSISVGYRVLERALVRDGSMYRDQMASPRTLSTSMETGLLSMLELTNQASCLSKDPPGSGSPELAL